MKKIAVVFAAAAMVTMLASCALHTTPSYEVNRQKIAGLETGMSEAEVTEVLGQPQFRDVFEVAGQERTTLYYYTNELGSGIEGFIKAFSSATVTRVDCTPLMFNDDRLYLSGAFKEIYY